MNKYRLIVLFFLVACIFSGCTKNYPLQGRVTFSDDGSPLEVGFVNFENEKGFARGEIKKGGYYNVGYVDVADGLPPGIYNIYISAAVIENPSNRNQTIMLVDPKQCRSDTSGWTLKIDGSTRTYNIQVNRPPK
ncbi:MAG: hypothetical protein LBC20_02450 [Planctomycetaceae bacterium]|jgi:hypothetical protein|nr:hypothetical protein [Planctomycetaceae bacterium]